MNRGRISIFVDNNVSVNIVVNQQRTFEYTTIRSRIKAYVEASTQYSVQFVPSSFNPLALNTVSIRVRNNFSFNNTDSIASMNETVSFLAQPKHVVKTAQKPASFPICSRLFRTTSFIAQYGYTTCQQNSNTTGRCFNAVCSDIKVTEFSRKPVLNSCVLVDLAKDTDSKSGGIIPLCLNCLVSFSSDTRIITSTTN